LGARSSEINPRKAADKVIDRAMLVEHHHSVEHLIIRELFLKAFPSPDPSSAEVASTNLENLLPSRPQIWIVYRHSVVALG
jgi:hypothetical protein